MKFRDSPLYCDTDKSFRGHLERKRKAKLADEVQSGDLLYIEQNFPAGEKDLELGLFSVPVFI